MTISCCGFATFSSLPLAIIRNRECRDLKSQHSIASYEERFCEPFDSCRRRTQKSAATGIQIFRKKRATMRCGSIISTFNSQLSTPHVRYHHPLCRAAAHLHKVNPCRGHSETQHPHSPRLYVQATPRNIIDAHRLALRTANNDI